jgi:hypothetical protein
MPAELAASGRWRDGRFQAEDAERSRGLRSRLGLPWRRTAAIWPRCVVGEAGDGEAQVAALQPRTGG